MIRQLDGSRKDAALTVQPVTGYGEDPLVLQRCVRELIGLSELPVTWSRTSTGDIPDSLAGILLTCLDADFVYVRIGGEDAPDGIEAARTSGESVPSRLAALSHALAPYLLEDFAASASVPHPFANGSIRVAIRPIGKSRGAGVILAGSSRRDFPRETERLLLEAGANQAAMVLEHRREANDRAQLLGREQAGRREAEAAAATLQRLEMVLEATLAPRRLVDLLGDLLRRTRSALDADTGVILLLDPDRDALIPVAADGFHDDFDSPVPIAIGAGVAGHIAVSEGGLIVEDLRAVELIRTSLREHISSLLGVPLKLGGRVIGVMHIGSAMLRRFTPSDLGFLRMVADRAALAIDRVRLDEAERTAHAEIERAGRLKDEFLAVLSHELRTPLNAIVGYAYLLEGKSLSSERAAHALDAIQRNAQAQVRLVESLLDVSRILAGKLELELRPVDLLSVVQSSVDVVRPTADAKQIQLSVIAPSAPIVVVGDPVRLEQVLWNVLSNAVKFTPAEGHICVRVACADAAARVEVTDTGQGIRAEFLRHVFDRFAQAEAGVRAGGGLGLGLALVRELIEAHGGTVTVASPGAGQGSTCIVRLPVATAGTNIGGALPGTQKTEPSRIVQTLTDIEVLVVDDDVDARDWLGFMLESRGATVRTVSSAQDAFESMQHKHADVLLADLRMPDEDGFTLIQKLRARERDLHERPLPAIAVTAYATPSDRERAIAAGFDRHITKPVNIGELVHTVAAMINGRTGSRTVE